MDKCSVLIFKCFDCVSDRFKYIVYIKYISKEHAVREALGMIGGDTSRAKKPPTQSTLKLDPLPTPKCFGAITQHLSNSPAPYVGLQVHVFNIWMQSIF